jgi:hypothetical protein
MSTAEIDRLQQQTVIKHDEVKGIVGSDERRPDRFFYILCGDEVWEADAYQAGKEWLINLICPKCHQNITIKSTKKPMQVDEYGLQLGEPIGCPWEGDFGTMCSFAIMLDTPKQSDRIAQVNGVQVKIDAVAKRV